MSIKNSLPSPFFSHYSVGDLRKDWKVCCLSRAKCWRMGTEVCVLLGILLLGTVVGRAAVAPLISAIPDQVTFEDVPILRVPFTIWDADTPLEQLRLSTHTAYGSSSFVSGGIDIGGAGSNRWFSIYPRADWFGPIYAAITVSDDAGLSATALFHVQVNPVNDPPRFSLIPDQTALRGQGVFSVPFVVSDPDTPINQVRLTAWSSRQSVVSNAYLRIATGSLQTNRSLVITLPTNGVAGSTAITIQADDLQSSNIVSFIVNVQPPDFVRTNSAGPATAENFQPGCGDFNGDGLLDLLVSPTQIYTNAGNGTLSPGITLPSGIVASSAAAADFDGDGNLDLLVYGSSLVRLFRNSGGSTPTFSEVPIGPRLSLPFGSQCRWADLDGDGAPDIVYASSGRVSWLRNNGAGEFIYMDTGVFISSPFGLLAVGDFDNDGDPDVLVSTTSAPRLFLNDGTGRLVDSQVALPPRETRAAGWTDIDGDGLLDLWLVQPTVESFFNSLIVLRQTGGRFVEVFRLTDPVFSQTPFVPVWADFDNDGNVDFVGRYFPFPTPNSSTTTPNSSTNYPSLYRNEGGGHFASTSLAVATTTGQLLTAVGDFDNDGSPDLLYRAGTTLLPMRNQSYRFNALPNAPTGLHALVADDSVVLFWNEASDANQTAALNYNVRVGTAPGKNDVVPSMSIANGTRLIMAPGNAGYKNWFALNLPLDRLNAEALYWSVQAVDNGFQGGPFSREQKLFIDPPGNQPPLITGISDLTFAEFTTNTLTLHVTDDRTPPEALRVEASSSNTNLFPVANVKLSGFAVTNQELRVTLSLKPAADQVGEATITVAATDHAGLSSSRFFIVTVTPVNHPPVLTVAGPLLALAGSPTPPLPVSASDRESPIEQLTLSAHSLSPQIIPDGNFSFERTTNGWQVVARPTNSEPAQATIQLTVSDPDGGQASRTVNVLFQRELLTPFSGAVDDAKANQLLWADFNGDGRMELLISRSGSLLLRQPQPGQLPQTAFVATADGFDDIGDVDNDGNLDLLVHVNTGNVASSRVFIVRNLGGFRFEQMPGAVFNLGAARLADFDRDGRLDVWVAENSTNLVVYRNTGAGFETGRRFALKSNLIDGESIGSLTLVDLDNDGREELGLSSAPDGVSRQAAFRWIDGGFVPITNGWASRLLHAIADFDEDQLPDLVVDLGKPSLKSFWRNSGELEFAQTASTLTNTFDSHLVAADFDADGSADALDYGDRTNVLYLGHRDLTFTPIQLPFAQANVAVVAPADFDGDGVMDIALSMSLTNLPTLAVYRGAARTTNHPPSSPANLRAAVGPSNTVVFSWNLATDPEQSDGLTYNVHVGTAPGLGDVVSPMSLADGYRLVPRRGNAWWNTNFILTALQPGRTYYWSVQAVDNSFVGGPFAAESSFATPGAALAASALGSGTLQLELCAAPTNTWKLEVSHDLKTWQEYSAPGAVIQTGMNGIYRMSVDAFIERQYFRARRVD